LDLLAAGQEVMLTKMHYRAPFVVAAHSHPHEQAGHVLSGRYRLTIGAGEPMELEPGDSYVIAGGVEHSLEVIDSGFVLDAFSPPREDYL
jgi:quercetin dioxygenase-like cupin family protein